MFFLLTELTGTEIEVEAEILSTIVKLPINFVTFLHFNYKVRQAHFEQLYLKKK